MLMVISPAKDLEFSQAAPTPLYSQPDLLSHAEQLIAVCRDKTPAELAHLMDISDKLAGLNAARFGSWQLPFTPDNAKQALFAFNGDVYQGLNAQTLSEESLAFAQQHLRILSGLYGVLRPLDLMQAYRLEMGTALATSRGKDLYQFWGDIITAQLNEQLEHLNADFLLNLASQEYFKAVRVKGLTRPVIDVQFKDQKNGQYKIISFFAKKARGMMARYVIEQRVSSVDALKAFAVDGYYFAADASRANSLVFLRDEQQ